MIEKESLNRAIAEIKAGAGSKNPKMAKYLVRLISKPKRKRIGVNIAKLEKFSKDGENVIVPGKVLGRGSMTKKINVAAVGYSEEAAGKLEGAQCTLLGFKEMLKKENIRIII